MPEYCNFNVLILLVALFLFIVKVGGIELRNGEGGTRHYCHGDWKEASHDLTDYRIQAARTIYNHSNPKTSLSAFLHEACPVQRAVYTCYFTNDDVDRSIALERRYFEINQREIEEKTCQPFYPASFLSLLRNRRVLLLGDSVMAQTWESIVCSLHTYDESKMYTDFWIMPDCPDRECPYKPHTKKDVRYNNPKHGNIIRGYLALKSSNVSISFVFYAMYERQKLQSMIKDYHLTKDDLLIYNQGLHYNDPGEYREMLKNLSSEISQLFPTQSDQQATSSSGSVDRPSLFFLHSTPQHFPTENGYYYDPITNKKANDTATCVALKSSTNTSTLSKSSMHSGKSTSVSLLHEMDWRNKLVHEILSDLEAKNQVYIVPTAIGLQDQYDAHVNRGDCTHWCFPSSVFKYLHLMLYNAMLKKLPSMPNPPMSMIKAEKDEDMTWALHPTLQNMDLVRYSHLTMVCVIIKGVLRPFANIEALKKHGYSLEQVRIILYHEVGDISWGPMIYADTILIEDLSPSMMPTNMPLTQTIKITKPKSIIATSSSTFVSSTSTNSANAMLHNKQSGGHHHQHQHGFAKHQHHKTNQLGK